MPRKFMFTKEEIVAAALEITRERGISAVTARSLAERLGSSSKPLFSIFENMSELHFAVIEAANREYQEFLNGYIKSGKYPPYKATGMGYIFFAKENKELFKLLFMRDRSEEEITDNDGELAPIIDIIVKNTGMSRERAYRFHLEMWLFVHGIATMEATSYLNLDDEFISNALTDLYNGLKIRFGS